MKTNFIHDSFSDPSVWIYDLETYPNIFTAAFENVKTGERRIYEISSRRNDLTFMLEFLSWSELNNQTHVGFNNLGFDYPIIHMIMSLGEICSLNDIYQKSQSIIDTDWNNRFSNVIWDQRIREIDLMKIHHFDNVSKATSLKTLEINMRMDSVEDLPFPVGTMLTHIQMRTLCDYNWHDIDATRWFFLESLSEIKLREDLSIQYSIDMVNFSDSKIGSEIFTYELEKAGVDCGRKGKPKQTKRDSIILSDCILEYVKFEQKGFILINYYLNCQVITQTKGALHGYKFCIWLIELSDGYSNQSLSNLSCIRYKIENQKSIYTFIFARSKSVFILESTDDIFRYDFRIEEDFDMMKVNGDISYNTKGDTIYTLSIIVDNIEYLFGTGGIHAANTPQKFEADDEYIIQDSDVKSYYPNLSIKNKFYPEHLTVKFCGVYENLYNKRASFQKGTPENAALKIALNASYGNSNNKYSNLYDPKFTMQITLNGQLLLCMLCEQLIKIKGLVIIAVNTDGICYRYKRKDSEMVMRICKWWEGITKGLELEHDEYSKFFLADVNNYLSVEV